MIRGFKLDLPDPDPGRVFFPAFTNIAKRWLVERALLQQFRVLLPAFGLFCTDNRDVHSGNAEGEAQRDRNTFPQIVVEKNRNSVSAIVPSIRDDKNQLDDAPFSRPRWQSATIWGKVFRSR